MRILRSEVSDFSTGFLEEQKISHVRLKEIKCCFRYVGDAVLPIAAGVNYLRVH